MALAEWQENLFDSRRAQQALHDRGRLVWDSWRDGGELFGPITRVYELGGEYFVLRGGELDDSFRSLRAAVRRAKVLVARSYKAGRLRDASRPTRRRADRDEPRSLLARIFSPRPPVPRTPSAAELRAREEYRRTGKHFWYAVTDDGLDFPVGRHANRSDARAAARRLSERKGRGAILRIYHLDS